MNNVSIHDQIAAAESQRNAVIQREMARQRERQQEALDQQALAQTEAHLRQLRIQAAAEQFNDRREENQRLVTAHEAHIARLYGSLDDYDLRSALLLLPEVERSFARQQAHKKDAVALLADEFQQAADALVVSERAFGTPAPDALAGAYRAAYMRRWSQLPDALQPFTVLAAYINGKTGDPRRIAYGLVLSLTGWHGVINPGYDAVAETARWIADHLWR